MQAPSGYVHAADGQMYGVVRLFFFLASLGFRITTHGGKGGAPIFSLWAPLREHIVEGRKITNRGELTRYLNEPERAEPSRGSLLSSPSVEY